MTFQFNLVLCWSTEIYSILGRHQRLALSRVVGGGSVGPIMILILIRWNTNNPDDQHNILATCPYYDRLLIQEWCSPGVKHVWQLKIMPKTCLYIYMCSYADSNSASFQNTKYGVLRTCFNYTLDAAHLQSHSNNNTHITNYQCLREICNPSFASEEVAHSFRHCATAHKTQQWYLTLSWKP